MSAPTKTHIATAVTDHLPGIQRLAREHGVARLDVIGDAAEGELSDEPRQPIYFYVTYPPGYDYGPWAERYVTLNDELSMVVNRDIHLIMSTAMIENEVVRTMIDEARQQIYVAS